MRLLEDNMLKGDNSQKRHVASIIVKELAKCAILNSQHPRQLNHWSARDGDENKQNQVYGLLTRSFL